jgi:hypothetical protein
MSTCGYICPSCNGTQLNEEGDSCNWCVLDEDKKKEASNDTPEITNQDNE